VGAVKHIFVHAEDDCRHIACTRCGNKHFLSARFDVFPCAFLVCEETCTFKDNIDVKVAPWKLCRIFLVEGFHFPAVDLEAALDLFVFTFETSLRCIIFHEMGEEICSSHVRLRFHCEVRVTLNQPCCKSSDTSKSINCYSYHTIWPPSLYN